MFSRKKTGIVDSGVQSNPVICFFIVVVVCCDKTLIKGNLGEQRVCLTHTHNILLRKFKARTQAKIEVVTMEESCLLVCTLDSPAIFPGPLV